MPTYKFVHELDLEYEDYPRLWDFEDYLDFLVEHHNAIRKVTKVEYKDEASMRIFKNKVLPELPIPGNLKKVISSDMLEYIEIVHWNKNENKHQFKMDIPKAKFVNTNGTMTLERIGDKKVKREINLTIDVKLPLVGGMLAKYLQGQLDSNYKVEAELRSKFAAQKIYNQ
jgi:hypothetical protein